MSFKKFISLIFLVALGSWIIWFFIFKKIDPYTSGFIGVLLFYWSLMLAFFNTIFLLGIIIRNIKKRRRVIEHTVWDSFRQAFFSSIFVFLVLLFSSYRLLNWWSFFLILLALSFLELFFMINQHKNRLEKHIKS